MTGPARETGTTVSTDPGSGLPSANPGVPVPPQPTPTPKKTEKATPAKPSPGKKK